MKRAIKSTCNDSSNIMENVKKKYHWTAGLLEAMEDPKRRIREDEKIVVIKDKYPKSEYHYLVLPKANIEDIWSVKKEDEEILLHMARIAEDLVKDHNQHNFITGFHAMPSMQRLHLHVVSTDFDSPHLKTKQHWNSFTTPFFLPSKNMCTELREKGKFEKMSIEEYIKYLNTPLKCHKCPESFKNMPSLKSHLAMHNRTKHKL